MAGGRQGGEGSRSREGKGIVGGRTDGRVRGGRGAEGAGGAGPSRMGGGHQRQRMQQKKHPEPLRRAIAQCLSASYNTTATSLTSEAVRTLQDYLANSSSIDSAYLALIDHAHAERDRSPPVIIKCVALLKRYLFRYTPRQSTLQQIDVFCSGLIAECSALGGGAGKKPTPWAQPVTDSSVAFPPESPPSPSTSSLAFASTALVKSLIYVRALVARHLPRYSMQSTSSIVQNKPLKPAVSSPHMRPYSSPYDRGLQRATSDGGAAKSAAMIIEGLNIEGLEEIRDDHGNYVAVDIMKWRWLGVKGQQAWAPSPVMLDSGGIARPHVERMQSLKEQGASGLMLKYIQQKENDLLRRMGDRALKSVEGVAEEMIIPSTVTTVTDPAAVRSHLRAVAAAKRHKPQTPQGWDMDVPPSTLRRRARPLFQYRHYSEQQPLRLSEVEMEEVVMAVCSEAEAASPYPLGAISTMPNSQAGRIAPEAADVAASVLIKLLIDMYMADPQSAAPLTLAMLQDMVGSAAASVRIRAFDLILNLGVHAQLLEPIQSEEQSIVEEQLPLGTPLTENGSFSSFGSFSGAARTAERHRLGRMLRGGSTESLTGNIERGTPPAVRQFESWLLDILCEMLLLLVQTEEAEEGVWAAALSCLLYMVCDRGKIFRNRLDGVDIRALKMLLEISLECGWADEVHSNLICIACNLLYKLPSTDESVLKSATLDLDQLEALGGTEIICEQYARARTLEARRNLFAVLFDFVLGNLEIAAAQNQSQFPSSEEIQAVASALTLAEASECFAFAFRQGVSGVGEVLANSITTAMARDVNSGRLNSEFLHAVVISLDKLAADYAQPEEEFKELLSATLGSEKCGNDSDLIKKSLSTLEFLLHSPRPSYRYSGYLWLLRLLSAEMTKTASKQSTKYKTNALQRQLGLLGKQERVGEIDEQEVEEADSENSTAISSAVHLLCGLLKSKNPSVRRGFVLILEKVLMECQRHGLDLEASSSNMIEGELRRHAGARGTASQERALAMLRLMNGALWQAISAKEIDSVNILQMCNMMFSQLCINWPNTGTNSARGVLANGRVDLTSLELQRQGLADGVSGRSTTSGASSKADSMCGSISGSAAAMLLSGQAAAPKLLVANMPTALLYWPIIQLAGGATEDVTLGVAVGSRGGGSVPGGACDVRVALLLILIGKCTEYQIALDEVGGEEFFRSLLDDTDARVAYYTSSFLLKRMMTAEPEKYQRMLHNLVFKAQQSNNEKLLENPYLQMRGILQLSSESDGRM